MGLLDEGLEDPCVDAGLTKAAGVARLVGFHRADGAAQGVAEGAAEEGALDKGGRYAGAWARRETVRRR